MFLLLPDDPVSKHDKSSRNANTTKKSNRPGGFSCTTFNQTFLQVNNFTILYFFHSVWGDFLVADLLYNSLCLSVRQSVRNTMREIRFSLLLLKTVEKFSKYFYDIYASNPYIVLSVCLSVML